MDVSETYIKMCGKAEEIQRERASLAGDFISDCDKVGLYPEVWGIDSIWLPRQDQLQDMVNPYSNESNSKWRSKSRAYDLLRVFISFCSGDEYEISQPTSYAERFTSIEQIWLAFVMKERYHKLWDGGEWV